MASLLTGYAETGLAHPKFVCFRRSDGKVWSTAGTPAFETWTNADVANYGIAATETSTTGQYTATDPADPTLGGIT